MDITVTSEKGDDGKVVAHVTVASADVDAAVKKTYKDIAYKYAFQGFRRGHAPRPVIDGIVGAQNVRGQATEDLLNAVQPLMIEELDVVPVERPSFDEEEAGLVEEGKDYAVTCTIVVPPTCELSSYDAPAIELPPEEATEAEIDQQVKQLLSYHTTYEDDDEATEVGADDIVSLDVESVIEGHDLEGEDRTFAMGNPSLPEGFRDGVVGMKVGETKNVTWQISHEHEGETHSHDFEVKVTVKSVKHAVTPELTDDFVKTGFGFDTVEELRDAVKEEIEEDKKSSLPTLKEDRVVEAMGERLELEKVPEAYGNQVFSELANEFMAQLQRQGMTLDMYLGARQIKSDDFVADLRAQADERSRQSLALDAISRKMEFEASDEDIRSEFERAGVDDVDATIKQWIDDGRMPAIRESIRRTKAVEWLVENAAVTEVDEIAKANAETAEAAGDDAKAEEAEGGSGE